MGDSIIVIQGLPVALAYCVIDCDKEEEREFIEKFKSFLSISYMLY